MRIVHIIDHLAASVGHAEVCRRLTLEQSRRGHACAIATGFPAPGFELPAGVALAAVGRAGAAARLAAPFGRGAVAPFLAAWRPDIVHLHGVWDATFLQAALASRRAGIPVVLAPHGVLAPWVVRRRRPLKRLFWILVARRRFASIGAWLATSKDEAAGIRAWGVRQPIETIPLGVDLPVSLPPGGAVRDRHGRRTALFLGRLHPKKGLPLLLEAWARVRPAGWRLVIAGPGSPRDVAAVQILRRMLGVEGEVEWVGEVRGPARDACYAAADLFVLPSYTENFGLVVVEALASGIPVITTRGTPWRELETHQCGWWVEANARALGCALRAATHLDDNTRRTMGLRGRELVREHYTWSACVDATLAAYGRLLRLDR